MQHDFLTLLAWADADDAALADVSREAVIEAAQAYVKTQWAALQQRHASGESGSAVVHQFAEVADTLVRGIVTLGARAVSPKAKVLSRVAVCALGGYGRGEMSPYSDLDICLVYDRKLTDEITALNTYVLPFFWDVGLKVGHGIFRVAEVGKLAEKDSSVYTSYAQARLVAGSTTIFARLQMRLEKVMQRQGEVLQEKLRLRETPEALPEAFRDLYALEPDVKESVGGLRDYHAALWMLRLRYGVSSLDEMERLGYITSEDALALVEGLDYIWRVRNELHFYFEREENRLTFDAQRHLVRAFHYGGDAQAALDRLMQDYYSAARKLRWFLYTVVRLCDGVLEVDFTERGGPGRSHFQVYQGQLCANIGDGKWFEENPARLMEIFWEAGRRRAPLSYATVCWVRDNLALVTDTFRSNYMVQRYFLAICRRPTYAAIALRQAAHTGLLAAYMPEFAAVQGMVRYADFHSYPVDEHTLRAVEVLAELDKPEDTVGRVLRQVWEQVRYPHVLVLATLLHDLGKAEGEEHVEVGVEIAERICERIALPKEEVEQVLFLVRHHMVMTNIAFYRDTNDVRIVREFAETMKSEERLRMLLLLTYADLAAVGPEVWNEWKGALLLKLFLKAERLLSGRAELVEEEEFWTLPKMGWICDCAPERTREELENYVRCLGERYFVSYAPERIVWHMNCWEAAHEGPLAVQCRPHSSGRVSEVLICTRDQHGLFAKIAGAFSSQLIDVESAALFTGDDGIVLDSFMVKGAVSGGPLTKSQVKGIEKVLQAVLEEGKSVQDYVEQARKRLFALLQPRVPVRTRVLFDNAASATDTVIDVDTGDRTGVLYDMAQALATAGLDIFAARIMTDARRVHDAFYVRNKKGKILEETEQEEISKAILVAVDKTSTTSYGA